MLSFIVCDDNEAILDRLVKMLNSLFMKHDFDAEVSFSTTNSDEALKYINHNNFDAVFLDIDLKSNISGLDIAKEIRKINKQAYIIFTSAHLEYILVAYQYKTFDFIPKPITIERLEDTIVRIIDDLKMCDKNSSFIKIDSKNTIINRDSIRYIKKDGMKLVFCTENRTYETYSSFSKISNLLPDNFVRCHKSYIANIDKITDINLPNNTIFFDINNNSKCYIGPKYKNEIMEVFNNERSITNNLE